MKPLFCGWLRHRRPKQLSRRKRGRSETTREHRVTEWNRLSLKLGDQANREFCGRANKNGNQCKDKLILSPFV